MSENKIIIYQTGEIDLEISISKGTIWLTQKEISQLFEKNRTVITKHINNILKDKEVNKKSNVQKVHFANSDKLVNLYSLDIVLAVGYRTNSAKAIKFRQWATKILKKYIRDKYVINTEKIAHQRLKEIENDLKTIKQKVSVLECDTTLPNQGIFFDGQIYDVIEITNF